MQYTLPDSIARVAERLAGERGHLSVNEYLIELVMRDEDSQPPAPEMEQAILDGLESGPATEMTRDDWDELRRRVRGVHGHRRTGP